MSQTTVLVIDDSATIRRLVDSQLSQSGYRVLLASTAEDGFQMAAESQPELILLDHQLPGTTGYEVCLKLRESDALRAIPVVISSTLRKRAYAEYTDLPNVVDMLPKPYTPELLKTTIANAIDTGQIIVESQAQGTAVPEVIQELAESALTGTFTLFSLRELLDFLNNGTKQGILEVETKYDRTWFFLSKGRIQAVSAAGTDVSEISETLPESLQSLAPVLNFTVGGRYCSNVDGLVELLDKKVVDPRLLRKLLRHQAAVLTRRCFTEELTSFRFEADGAVPPLFKKLPIDISTAALLVDAALHCGGGAPPTDAGDRVYARRSIRGQNLDRAGLSPIHMKVVGTLADPLSCTEVAYQLKLTEEEAHRVLSGFVMAELIEEKGVQKSRQALVLESDPAASRNLQAAFGHASESYVVKVVRDRLALQLRLKRMRPHVVVLPIDSDEDLELLAGFQNGNQQQMKLVRIVNPDDQLDGLSATQELPTFDALVRRPYTARQLIEVLDSLFADVGNPVADRIALQPVSSMAAGTNALGS